MQPMIDEERLLKSVALQTANAVLVARQRVESDLVDAKDALELKTGELDSSLAMARATLESTTDGILAVNEHRIVTTFNHKFAELWGLSPELIHSKHHGELLDVTSAHFDDPTAFRGRIDDIYETAPPETYDLLTLRDGRVIERFSNLQWIGDRQVGRVWSFRDVTQREQNARVLIESEERFRTMANSVPLLAWRAAADGYITWYNSRWYEYTGTTLQEMEGSGWQSVHDPAVLPAVLAEWNRVLQLGEPFEMEFPLRGADGIFRTFLTRVAALRDAEGRLVSWFGTNTEVEVLKAAERKILRLNAELEDRVLERTAALNTANKDLQAFSHSISHDLRSPLRTVGGFSQAVLDDFGDQLPEKGRQYLHMIRDGALKMTALIEDLLSFAQVGRVALKQQTVNTARLVTAVLAELKAQHQGRHIETRVGHLPDCIGDRALLRQVWINLLSNAFKYTQHCDAPIVEIGCEQRPEGNTYFVCDNGVGFDMRYAGKLFGVFQRMHRAVDFEGTGVGLAIVQQVVQRHGGRVWADAQVNRGATFRFTLGEPGHKAKI